MLKKRNISIFRCLLFLFYLLIFRYTPENYRPYSFFFPYLRYLIVSYFTQTKLTNKILVKHNAEVSPFIKVGYRSELGTRCLIQSHVIIGDNVIMGPDVKIYSRNHIFSSLEYPIQDQGKKQLKTIIGNDVWIGANVIITAGCEIGDHCVIAAGAVVTSNFADYSVIGGVPAKLIKKRR